MTAAADRALLATLELRATAFGAIRRFFDERGFIEVDTPAVVPCPGLDVHLSAFEVRDPAQRRVGWLATSPEYQMKRLLSAGAKRIFQLGRSYRAEEHGCHHEREFTMLEWYRAEASSDDVIADSEALVAFLAELLADDDDASDFYAPPWERVTVEEALRQHAGAELKALQDDEERFFLTWAERVQPRLGLERPVVVTDWPSSMASLARIKPNGMADRFEVFIRGIEVCNGFGELTDPREQRERFERDQAERRTAGAPVYPIDERFLDALERGMPESGGNALGVDRLLMLLVGAESIQAVMPFPQECL
ncbi:MAG TPA: EF-P lysine aminoacylase EpmA [Polyangiales bacterium]|nr:EF-P lysine aminoacylase EpmA [Polyangiales bacterium]